MDLPCTTKLLPRWNSVGLGPKRDIIDELAVASRKPGLVSGLLEHSNEPRWFVDEDTWSK